MIEVRGVSKRFRLGAAAGGFPTLRDRLASAFGGREPAEDRGEFWALRDVSFEVGAGETLGIIGSNGAGKSTLLKILSRITEPTRGEAILRGRIASLLEVGTGFHPELTGRENIFLNGVILGMKRTEVRRRFDAIVEFSGVEMFLDTPVKRYSSGMFVRLAFAVASHLDPEILVVDEVLAVGDAAFQEKCLGKMGELAGCGRTVLFVSHNMAAVENLTRRAIVLDHGRVVFAGPTPDAVARYLQPGSDGAPPAASFDNHPRPSWLAKREARLAAGVIENHGAGCLREPPRLRVDIELLEELSGLDVVVKMNARDGQALGTLFLKAPGGLRGAVLRFVAEVPDPGWAPGHYTFSIIVITPVMNPADAVLNVLPFEYLPAMRAGGRAWRPDWGHLFLGEHSIQPVAVR